MITIFEAEEILKKEYDRLCAQAQDYRSIFEEE